MIGGIPEPVGRSCGAPRCPPHPGRGRDARASPHQARPSESAPHYRGCYESHAIRRLAL